MTSFGRGFLGEATSRMSRLLGIEGEIPLKFSGEITPVVVLGDGTSPGMGNNSTRRWGNAANVTGAATSTNWGIKATEDVVITRITVWIGTAGAMSVAYLGPNATDPWTMASATGIFLDRSRNVEVAPITTGASNAVAETAGIFYRPRLLSTVHTFLDVEPFLLMKGSKLLFRWAAAVVGEINIMGRTP